MVKSFQLFQLLLCLAVLAGNCTTEARSTPREDINHEALRRTRRNNYFLDFALFATFVVRDFFSVNSAPPW